MKRSLCILFFCMSIFSACLGYAASLTIKPQVDDGTILVIIRGQGGMQQDERSHHFLYPYERYHVPEGTKTFGTGFLQNYTNDLWFFAISQNCVWTGKGRKNRLHEPLFKGENEKLLKRVAQKGFSFIKNQRVPFRHVYVKADAKRWPLFEITLTQENSDNGCLGHNFLEIQEEVIERIQEEF